MAYPIAKRFIAGETLHDAIERAKTSNSRGMSSIINNLGEHTVLRPEVEQMCREYALVLQRMEEEKIRGSISIKPSQIGLAIDYESARGNLRSILSAAEAHRTFIWLDMEGSDYTQRTIDLYDWLNAQCSESGLAIQANLKRTRDDLKHILSEGGVVRLCKGAYQESPEIAWKSKSDVERSFEDLMALLFAKGKRFAIATHDQKLIDKAVELTKSSAAKVEFQMLMGIRDDLKPELVNQGFSLSEYIPYGKTWFPYSIRRLRERKRNILLLVRALIS